MAENGNEEFEHAIDERLKKLDAQIKVPEIPDAQTIFEKAKTAEKSNVRPFGWSKISTVAAAVAVLCIAVPLAIHNPFLKAVSKDKSAEMNDVFFEENNNIMMRANFAGGQEAMSEDSVCDETVESRENVAETPMMAPQKIVENSGQSQVDGYGTSVINGMLSDHFSSLKAFDSSKEKTLYVSECVSHFEDKLSKKRSIEVDINGSVSVILYDTSGETEILSAFWVEGIYTTSDFDGEVYKIEMYFPITKTDFENGEYLPLIGDGEKGTYQLSEDDIIIEGDIAEAIIFMTVKINVENGSYAIDAVLK